MDKIDCIQYGVASNLQYKLTIDHVNPATGLDLQLTDLYVSLYLKSTLTDDDLFTIVGAYNSTDEAFDFTFSQVQADLLTIGTWYYGFEVRITDIDGKVIHRNTYSRKIVKTGGKE